MGYLDPETENFLIKEGIRRVISGHQPHTDSPWIMKKKDNDGNTKITVITADTS